jgi:hypothetical protein
MANCSGCGLVMGVVVWITEPYGALGPRSAVISFRDFGTQERVNWGIK